MRRYNPAAKLSRRRRAQWRSGVRPMARPGGRDGVAAVRRGDNMLACRACFRAGGTRFSSAGRAVRDTPRPVVAMRERNRARDPDFSLIRPAAAICRSTDALPSHTFPPSLLDGHASLESLASKCVRPARFCSSILGARRGQEPQHHDVEPLLEVRGLTSNARAVYGT